MEIDINAIGVVRICDVSQLEIEIGIPDRNFHAYNLKS